MAVRQLAFLVSTGRCINSELHLGIYCLELCFRCLYGSDTVKQIQLAWDMIKEYLLMYMTHFPRQSLTIWRFSLEIDEYLSSQQASKYFEKGKNLDFLEILTEQYDSLYVSMLALFESCKGGESAENVTARVVSAINSIINQKVLDTWLADDPIAALALLHARNLRDKVVENNENDCSDTPTASPHTSILLNAVYCREWSKISNNLTRLIESDSSDIFYTKSIESALNKWRDAGF